jgi:hypothetical protein
MTVQELRNLLDAAKPDAPVVIWQGVDNNEEDIFVEIDDGVTQHEGNHVTLKLRD